jgi:multiple sugar transport system permease protein
MTTQLTANRPLAKEQAPRVHGRRRKVANRILLHAGLILTSMLFLIPILWAVYTAFRPYSDTALHGYVSVARSLTLSNFTTAWSQGDMPLYFGNTMIVILPAIAITLLLSAFVAFAVTRMRLRGSGLILIAFTAGNLLPPQVLLTPLFRLYIMLPLPQVMSDSELLYDSYWGIILIHVAVQTGFCTFVLANYMRTLPEELTEAAVIDGAGALRQFWFLIMPLCRPAFAALATLEFNWLYNDFFWAMVLMSTGSKMPITSALNNLQGDFFTNNNLLAAGSLIVALPTMIVYFALQKQFVGGLTMGSTKG